MSRRTFQNIIFKDCGPKLPIAKIIEFEQQIDVTLPEDFRRFLGEINGGVSEAQGFRCVGNPPMKPKREEWSPGTVGSDGVFLRKKMTPRIVTQFFGLDLPKGEGIVRICSRRKILDSPDTRSLIPIGRTKHFRDDWIDGDDLAISVNKKHFGFVYCCKTGASGKSKALSEIKSLFVAENFSEFLSKLTSWHDKTIFRP